MRFLRANITEAHPIGNFGPRNVDFTMTCGATTMIQPNSTPRDDSRELARVAESLASRLTARGVAVHADDSPDAIVLLLEQVEAFERTVEAAGGDLMVDEPPANHKGQPDDPHFLLPARGDDESARAFAQRLADATLAIRRHKPHP